MKIYYPHFTYDGSADDAYYYGGCSGRKFLSREDAVAEGERVLHAHYGDANLPPMAECIEDYFICEEEVL